MSTIGSDVSERTLRTGFAVKTTLGEPLSDLLSGREPEINSRAAYPYAAAAFTDSGLP